MWQKPLSGSDPSLLEPRVSAMEDQKANEKDFDANKYGADPAAAWTVNRDAFQAANDAAVAAGGGRIVAKPGVYLAKGIIQDGDVEFSLPGVVLKNPDGLLPNVINSRTFTTTGSISAGGQSLTVADASKIKLGTVLAIGRAGGILNTQYTTLSTSIDAVQTTGITLTTDDGHFPSSGYMLVGTELIQYTGISSAALVGVTRGALGTTAATHAAGDNIGVATNLYAEVTGVSGTTVTINTTAVIGVSNATITIGTLRPAISGLKIDGNRVIGGAASSVYGVTWELVRWGRIRNLDVINGDMGGLLLTKSTTECDIDSIHFHDVGVFDAASPKGAGLWLFQGNKRNKITKLTATGRGWVGVYVDDRTTTSTEWDAPNYDNRVDGFDINLIRPGTGFPPGFIIIGSSRNKFLNGVVSGPVTGVEIDDGSQFLSPDGLTKTEARDNEVAGVHFNVDQPWILSTPGNRLHECTYTDAATSVPTVQPGNLVYAVTTTKGQPVSTLADVKFSNGTPAAPGITFVDDTDTGFYKDADNVIHVTVGGVKKFSFYGTEIRLADGMTLATGTVSGTKIGLNASQMLGFFGKTPMVQPAAIANTSGATLTQLETDLNLVKTTLRNLGFIAP
jgi:hypothetical protein